MVLTSWPRPDSWNLACSMLSALFLPPSTIGSIKDEAIFTPVLMAAVDKRLIAVAPITPMTENFEAILSTLLAIPSNLRLLSSPDRALVVDSTPLLNCPLSNCILTMRSSTLLMRFEPLSRHSLLSYQRLVV